jgi:hypothetical protein
VTAVLGSHAGGGPGAEALRELIDFYVVGDKTSRSEHPVGLTIDRLWGLQRIAFLATTTNITLAVGGQVRSGNPTSNRSRRQ